VNGDVIRLQFPARPEYILAVRLAVSAVAERVGFDIEDIEDLKVASAEACTLLLSAGADTIDISLVVQSGLELLFEANTCWMRWLTHVI
jgi:serine/threonine-protein kinase RsbW